MRNLLFIYWHENRNVNYTRNFLKFEWHGIKQKSVNMLTKNLNGNCCVKIIEFTKHTKCKINLAINRKCIKKRHIPNEWTIKKKKKKNIWMPKIHTCLTSTWQLVLR